MKYVITGAAGFIGSNLASRLLSESGGAHEVIGVDNLFTGKRENLPVHPRFEFVRHDVCDPWHMDCDGIFHLACPASPVHYQRNPVRTIRTAVQGTITALECARDTNAKIVIASTSEVYGDPEEHPQKESYWGHVNPVGARSNYDEGKRCAESMAVAWENQYGVRVRIARIFNSYGPNMAPGDGRLLPNLITQAIADKPMTVQGTGTQTRSFCYVTDTIDALIKMMDADGSLGNPFIVNVGNPDERTINSVANDVRRLCRSHSEIVHTPLPEDDPKRRYPDITRAKEWLKWSPDMGFEEGLRATIFWFRSL